MNATQQHQSKREASFLHILGIINTSKTRCGISPAHLSVNNLPVCEQEFTAPFPPQGRAFFKAGTTIPAASITDF